jgi:hypothetical protein
MRRRFQIFSVSVLSGFVLSGCMRLPALKLPGSSLLGGKQGEDITVTAPRDTGKPGTVETQTDETRMKVPAGSTVTETAVTAQPATDTTPARPAYTVREIKLVSDTEWVDRAQRIAASTGTVDTSVAKHRIDMAEARWLLIGGLLAVVGGFVVRSLLPAWPGLSNGLILGGGVSLAAWKLSAIPPWLGLVVVGVFAVLALGYKKKEWDANSDGIPDVLQRKTS